MIIVSERSSLFLKSQASLQIISINYRFYHPWVSFAPLLHPVHLRELTSRRAAVDSYLSRLSRNLHVYTGAEPCTLPKYYFLTSGAVFFLLTKGLLIAALFFIFLKSSPDLPSNWSSLRDLCCTHSNYKTLKCPILLFIVTTSPYWDWVIYAPAAFLRCGSRFSCSLSVIEPWSYVTRWRHGSPIHYRRQLIGQKLEWFIVGTRPYDSLSYYDSPQHRSEERIGLYLINTTLHKSGLKCMY